MDTTLKQRLLGIIVLFALLGLCLTALLHNNKSAQRDKTQVNNPSQSLINSTSSLVNTSSATLTPGTSSPVSNITTQTLSPNGDLNSTSSTDVSQNSVFDSTTPHNSTTITAPPTASSTVATMTAPNNNTATNNEGNTQTNSLTASVPPAQQSIQSTIQSTTNNAANTLTPPSQSSIAAATTPALKPTTNSVATAKPADLTLSQQVASSTNAGNVNTEAASSSNTTAPSKIATLNSLQDSKTITATNPSSFTSNTVTHNNSHQHKSITANHNHKNVTPSLVTHHSSTEVSSTLTSNKNFVVQVGSFNLSANAETLADKLRANGFKASTQKISTAQGEMIRVVVGGAGVNHQTAETLRETLAKNLHLQGFIVSGDQSTPIATTKNNKEFKTKTKSITDSTTSNTIVPDDSNLQ